MDVANSRIFIEDTSTIPVSISSNNMAEDFFHGFVKALSAIIMSEFGGNTFFIAAILAMTTNDLVIAVFMTLTSALAIMTILSASLGLVPLTSYVSATYCFAISICIMFLMGLIMLCDAYKMKPSNEKKHTIQNEVPQEIYNR